MNPWGATAWLLSEANHAKDVAATRVDAIKTGLSIAAGTGGVFALLLAVRRQWHQELTAQDTTQDATERRVTELYTKAADQLVPGSWKGVWRRFVLLACGLRPAVLPSISPSGFRSRLPAGLSRRR
jgi:hypothetical protein